MWLTNRGSFNIMTKKSIVENVWEWSCCQGTCGHVGFICGWSCKKW
jgi:hypothetical protein